MLSRQDVERMVWALPVFKGHDTEEYSPLIEPLTEFLWDTRHLNIQKGDPSYNLAGLEKLVRAILGNRAAPTDVCPERGQSLTTAYVADLIEPWVEDVREELFHSREIPLGCLEDAEAWMDAGRKALDEWNNDVRRWLAKQRYYHACWNALYKKYPLLRDSRWRAWIDTVPTDRPTQEEIEQLSKDDQQRVALLKPGEAPEQDEQARAYYALVNHASKISRATGFIFESVQMCILIGTPPAKSLFTFHIVREGNSLPSGTRLVNQFAQVTMWGDLTFKDLRLLHRRVRRALGVRRSKRFTEKHLQVYRMVKESGNIPKPGERGTQAFWELQRKEWNRSHSRNKDQYSTWQGIRGIYKSTVKRLGGRLTLKEVQNER